MLGGVVQRESSAYGAGNASSLPRVVLAFFGTLDLAQRPLVKCES